MGAPVQSFDRLSDKPITVHCAVTNPDFVVVLDPTLMDCIPVTEGLTKDGRIIVNTSFSAKETAEKLGIDCNRFRSWTLLRSQGDYRYGYSEHADVRGSCEVIGNLDINGVLEDTKHKLELKFRHKPQVIEGNLASIKRAYDEVKNA